jgi:hypothetical protein
VERVQARRGGARTRNTDIFTRACHTQSRRSIYIYTYIYIYTHTYVYLGNLCLNVLTASAEGALGELTRDEVAVV